MDFEKKDFKFIPRPKLTDAERKKDIETMKRIRREAEAEAKDYRELYFQEEVQPQTCTADEAQGMFGEILFWGKLHAEIKDPARFDAVAEYVEDFA